MPLKEQLSEDLKDAIRQGGDARKTAIRMVIAAIKNAEVAAGQPLEDKDVLAVIGKQVKQRRESIEEFQKAKRQDLVDKEEAELHILQTYMPPAISRDEIVAEAKAVIEEVGAAGPSDKGKVMQALMPRLAGKADGRDINEVATELLSQL